MFSRPPRQSPFVAKFAGVIVASAVATAAPVRAEDDDRRDAVEFDSGFLHGTGGATVDVSRFSRGNSVLPGEYLVDLVVNDSWIDRRKVRFVSAPGQNSATPCFDRELIGKLGLDLGALGKATKAEIAAQSEQACVDIASLSPDIRSGFDQAVWRLDVSIPQGLIHRRPRGYVGPESWDKGVPSAVLRYDINFFHEDSRTSETNSGYLRLAGGVNLGTWHLRQRSSLTFADDDTHWQNIATYLLHDLPSIKSRLVIGDSFTDGAVFDSFGFRGAAIGTDDRMRPESQSGYAPVVRGIARTNARVRITQNGALLLETTVAPGQFVIDDLYPTGYGGDLEVMVLEADGGQQSFKVAYAALPQLLRPGVLRYNIAAGEFRQGDVLSSKTVVQAALQYGLTNNLTASAGMQISSDYAAGLIGAALNTPLGALALDTTFASTRLPTGGRAQGYSIRASYSKILTETKTNFGLAAYRYSSSGFYSLQDAMRLQTAGQASAILQQKERVQINITQDLPRNYGNLYLTGSRTNYWGREGGILQAQAGYTNVVRTREVDFNYGLSYARQRDLRTGLTDNRVLLSISFAAGRRPNAPQISGNFTRAESGGEVDTSAQVAVIGTVGGDQRLSYSLVATAMPDFDAISVGLGYRAPFAMLNGNVSAGTGFKQASLGMSGGIVVHPGGVTLTNQLEDTVAVVFAPGARGAKVRAGTGIVIDADGYAVVPYLVPYRLNDISLDPEGLPAEVELKTTSQKVAPYADSVVMVTFGTVTGRRVIVTATRPDGSPVPFGASVLNAQGAEIAIVGQDGQIFLRSSEAKGDLSVKWDEGADGQCSFAYALPPAKADAHDLAQLNETCRTTGASVIAVGGEGRPATRAGSRGEVQ